MNDLYDVVIIGAGPAGLTAAIYAKNAKLKTLLIEKSVPGGQLVNIRRIANYPGYKDLDGANLASIMYEQVLALDVKIAYEEVIDIIDLNTFKKVVTNKNTYNCLNVIVATGISYTSLKIANEKNYEGKGLSYCAICDGSLYNNKEIAVFINNNKAIEDCLYLARYAKKIYIINGVNVTFPETMLSNPQYEFYLNYKISKLEGKDVLEKIVITKDSETKTLNVQGLFVLNNSKPSSSFLSKFNIFASNGYMKVDENYESLVKGIFGIGDVIDKKLRQVVTSCADGAKVSQYLASNKK